MSIFGIVLMVLAKLLAPVLAGIFVGYDPELFEMTTHAFKIFAYSFLLAGLNIFVSSFFTALNNGAVSAAISFLRTLVFQMLSGLILPILLMIHPQNSSIPRKRLTIARKLQSRPLYRFLRVLR